MISPSIRLRRAILLNDVLLVKRIVRNHPSLLQNPDFEDKSNTSLHLAAANGCVEIAELLIQAGHDATEISRNTNHDTPLTLAAQNGHVEVGRLLIERFPGCIPCTNKVGLDALAMASQHLHSTALIPVLISNERFPASPHVRDQDGNTPLHHASASGSLKALRILLSVGADPLAKNNYDWTPLAYSQTVAAEVYFKNLIAESERRKAENAKQGEERERQRAAGVRLVNEGDDDLRTPVGENETIEDALKRHWAPIERKGPMTPGGGALAHEWDGRDGRMMHIRARSGSGE